MRLILDTNVLMSGVFFAGPPAQILEAWSDGEVQLVRRRLGAGSEKAQNKGVLIGNDVEDHNMKNEVSV